MASAQTNLLQGTRALLLLKPRSLAPLHGLGRARRRAQRSHGTFQLTPGSLFPARRRKAQVGWLSASWGQSANKRRAKYDRLSRARHQPLKPATQPWARLALGTT